MTTPRKLGLRADNRDVQEAVGFLDANPLLAPEALDVLRLLKKRRHETPNLVCLAAVGDAPPRLDPLLKPRFSPEVMGLLRLSRLLRERRAMGADRAPDEVKTYLVARAAVALKAKEDYPLIDIADECRLSRKLAGKTSDPVLETLLARLIADRKALHGQAMELPSLSVARLPNREPVRGAFALLTDFTLEGSVTPREFNHAMCAAGAAADMLGPEKGSAIAALCLVDGALSGKAVRDTAAVRSPDDDSRAIAAVGAAMMVEARTDPLHMLDTPERLVAAGPGMRAVAAARFISDVQLALASAPTLLVALKSHPESAVVKRRVQDCQDLETYAQAVITPALGSLAHAPGLKNNIPFYIQSLAALNKRIQPPKPPSSLLSRIKSPAP